MSDFNGLYKVRPRTRWDWRNFNLIRMEISVGQPYHEGAKLAAAMDWARKNFKEVVLIIGDLPQRYNIMLKTGYSEQNAALLATGTGTDWLERNAQYLHGTTITRWSDWKRHADYLLNRSVVGRLYTEDEIFRETITGAMDAFSARHGITGEDLKRYMKLTENYLLEETAIFATAYEKLGGISAYPGSFLETFEMCIDHNNPLIPLGLKKSHSVRLSFDRIDQRAGTTALTDSAIALPAIGS